MVQDFKLYMTSDQETFQEPNLNSVSIPEAQLFLFTIVSRLSHSDLLLHTTNRARVSNW